MSADAPQYYWDTCVFIAYLNDERQAYGAHVDHIGQFLDEAREGKCKIYCSTITIAEVTRKSLVKASVGTFREFLADFRAAVIPVVPEPSIMLVASHLRGLDYTKTGGERKLATPDAIHIATALALQETYKVEIDAFHTFDAGKSKGPDGPSMPIIGYETWCEQCKDDPVVKRVIALNREHPTHPSPRLHE